MKVPLVAPLCETACTPLNEASPQLGDVSPSESLLGVTPPSGPQVGAASWDTPSSSLQGDDSPTVDSSLLTVTPASWIEIAAGLYG